MNFLFIQLYLILVLIRPQDYPDYVDAITVPVLQIVLGLALVSWLMSRDKSFSAPQYLLLLMFLLVLMVSKLVNGWAGGMLEQLLVFGPIVLVFLLMANAITTARRAIITMSVFTISAVVLSIHGIQQAELGIGWTGQPLSQGTRIQYVGIFNDPNDLGMLFVVCLPMAFYLAARGGLLGLRRLFWLAGAGVLLWGVYLANSRGAFLAVVVLVAIHVWQRRGALMAGIFGGIALTAMLALPSRLQELDVDEESAAGRVDAWYQGFQMFLEHPILGVGGGNFTDINPLTAHNSFVLVLAETGYVGFTIWFAFVTYCFWMMIAVLKHKPALADGSAEAAWASEQRIAKTLLFSLCAFFSAGFFLSRSYAILLYVLAALVVGYYTGVRKRYPSLPDFSLQRDAVRWPMISIGVIVGLYLVIRTLVLAE